MTELANEVVHVVLLNRNRWRDTVECLESVLRSDYENLRVIVVDNASTDDSLERLKAWARGEESGLRATTPTLDELSWPPIPKPVDYSVVPAAGFHGDGPKVTFVVSPGNLGFAKGNNVALRPLVETDRPGYVLVLNNDTVIAPTAVTALVRALSRNAGAGAVGAVLLDYHEPDLVQLVGGGRMSHLTATTAMEGAGLRRADVREPAPNSLGYLSGACVLMRVETLRRVGLLDERYFIYAEDADWGEQMRANGCELGCATDAIVWHKGSQTMVAGSPFQDYHLVLSALLFVRKNSRHLLPIAATYMLMRSLLPKVVRAQWTRARSVLRAYADFSRAQ